MAFSAPSRFGKLLKHYRIAATLSQEALAEKASLSTRGISDLERGIRILPRLETVQLLADALNLSQEERSAFVAAARPDNEQILPSYSSSMHEESAFQLPLFASPLIGREQELERIGVLLRDKQVRLLTLTGSGGIGKTRLAVQAAHMLADIFPNGIVFVALASLPDTALVLPTIAQALSISEHGSQPLLDRLIAFLHTKSFLLLLDNFEQVLPAAPFISELLTHCPRLSILTTSRSALHIHGEQLFHVPPLNFTLPITTFVERTWPPAVELFLNRVRAIDSDFEVTTTIESTLVNICRLLDGLPLAIELAASCMRLFSPQQLRERLQSQSKLALLTTGTQDAPSRQQTLHATIQWSYDLLQPNQQVLFWRLAVFANGWTVEAGEAVCATVNNVQVGLLDGLLALLDQCLIQREQTVYADDTPRFRMLATIQEFALERLAESDEQDSLFRQLATYLLSLHEHILPLLVGEQRKQWLLQLEAEQENVRSVLQWACQQAHKEFALQLSGLFWSLWETRGSLSEGRSWLENALQGSDPSGERLMLHAQALHGLGSLAAAQGDYEYAKAVLTTSLTLYEQIGITKETAQVLNRLGNVALDQGKLDAAIALQKQSLARFETQGDIREIAHVLANLGYILASQGKFEQAEHYHQHALLLQREMNDHMGLALSLNNMAELGRLQNDFASARASAEESLALFEHLEDGWGIALAQNTLGAIVQEQGDVEPAATLYYKSLARQWERGEKAGIARTIERIANLSTMQSQWHTATLRYAVASALREQLGVPFPPIDAHQHEQDLAILQAELGNEAFKNIWDAGRTLAIDAFVQSLLVKTINAPTAHIL